LHEVGNRTTKKISLTAEDECRSDIRMPGERDFVGRGEYPHAGRIGGVVRGQHERGFGVVEFGGDALHLGIAEAPRVWYDGERVAGETSSRENIDGYIADRNHTVIVPSR